MEEILFTFERFPASICTQVGDITTDEKLLECKIVKQPNNLVQFLPYINPEEIYLEQHNSSIGETWQLHNELFSKFVKKYESNDIVEIGGGTGNIFSKFETFNTWKTIDLNPSTVYDIPKVSVIKSIFKPSQINEKDIVISSHVIEHMFYVEGFLQNLRNRMPKYHIFSMPNMKEYANSKYSATIMQEHPTYLPEEVMDVLLKNNGWKVIEKFYFKNHSIFYATEPSTENYTEAIPDRSVDVVNLLRYLKTRALSVKDEKFYVFGAHLTYYYLLNMGIDESQVIAVVDNDKNKCGKRMYGFNTPVIHSSELDKNAKVFLEMGPYNEEIRKKLNNIEFV